MNVNSPISVTLEQLDQLVNNPDRNYHVAMVEATRWVNWESALTLMARDLFVVEVARNTEFPIYVSFDPNDKAGESIAFNEEMQFIVRPKKKST